MEDRYHETREGRADLMENKRAMENLAAENLLGKVNIKEAGPREFRPEVPDALKGVLLKGQRSWDHGAGTKADAKRKHRLAVRMGYIGKDVPVRFNDDGTYTVITK